MAMRKLAILLLLSGCANSPPPFINTCPAVPVYDRAFQQNAAQQLAALPANSPLVKMISDYLAMRRASEDCAR